MKKIFLNFIFLLLLSYNLQAKEEKVILNISYDTTREFFAEINPIFENYYYQKYGVNISIKQSHGGSGKQARAVLDGLKADLVSLALAHDIDEIARKTSLIEKNWQELMPYNSSPYQSTIVFLVRKNNPKKIYDWNDLVKNNVKIVTPNPKISGGARWNYLAAYAYAKKRFNNDSAKINEFIGKIFANVPILDSSSRASVINFVYRNIGDVLITWENEAHLAIKELGSDHFEIINPSLSILAEPPIAIVTKNAKKNHNYEIVKSYMEFLFSNEIQEKATKYYYRPANSEILKKYSHLFANIHLVTINDLGGWSYIQKEHFADGGIFDQIYTRR